MTTKDWQLAQPGRKLAHLASGPYKIINKIGNSYELDLPDSIQVHPVFHASKLRRAATTEPLTGQHVDPPPPIKINEEDEWEVDKLLDARTYYRKLQYRVQWLGHDLDLQWYPAGNFKHAPQKVQEFHDQYPSKPGPPMRLQDWIDASKRDIILDEHPDDDKPAFRG